MATTTTTTTASAGHMPMGPSVPRSNPVDMSLPIPLANLRGKTILITGGSSGFGAACARHWATHGATIVVADISIAAGEALVADLRASTANAAHAFVRADVTNWSSQLDMFAAAARASPHGGIDVVMANAGIADYEESALFEDPPDYVGKTGGGGGEVPAPRMRTLDVNLTGVMYTAHLALSYLARNPGSKHVAGDATGASTGTGTDTGTGASTGTGEGERDRCLLLVASVAGLMPLVGQPIYCVAKHGVVGLFRALRVTGTMHTGVRVNMICPYFVDTPILGGAGSLLLAGGGMATVADVVDASTRLVADTRIVGRALAIGSKTAAADAATLGLVDSGDFKTEGQAVWEVYADDFGQTDLFTRRVIAITNLVTVARGWAGLVGDVLGKIGRAVGL